MQTIKIVIPNQVAVVSISEPENYPDVTIDLTTMGRLRVVTVDTQDRVTCLEHKMPKETK